MVRTTGGIRISAGKSSKKSGGGSGSTRSAPSTPSGKIGSRAGSSRLPAIPHCEAPSWQKPITNFFNVGAGSSKDNEKIKEKAQDIIAEESNKENNFSIENNSDQELKNDKTEITDDKDDFNISGVEILENENEVKE